MEGSHDNLYVEAKAIFDIRLSDHLVQQIKVLEAISDNHIRADASVEISLLPNQVP